jgi:hypothetical protein
MRPAQAMRRFEKALDDIFAVAEWQARRVLRQHGASDEEIAGALEAQNRDLRVWREQTRKQVKVWFTHGADLH